MIPYPVQVYEMLPKLRTVQEDPIEYIWSNRNKRQLGTEEPVSFTKLKDWKFKFFDSKP